MAIMRTCCCCGIRSGSIACAIYTIVIALLGIGSFAYSFHGLDDLKFQLYELKQLHYDEEFVNLDIDAYILTLKVDYIMAFIVLGAGFITSILAIVGINQDSKNLLVPFIFAKFFGLVWYLYAIAVLIYAVTTIGMEYKEAGGVAFMAELIILFPFLVTDIVCVLCVLSQYQEYLDGRGRRTDNAGVAVAQRQTVVVVQQQQIPPGTGAFAYGRMQEDLPPAYGNPAVVSVKTVPGAI